MGYLHTYQNKPDGTPTNNFCYETQENLCVELGTSLSTLKRDLKVLLELRLIVMPPKSEVDNKRQYKGRKAYKLIDANLSLLTKEPKEIAPIEPPVEIVQTAAIIEATPELLTIGKPEAEEELIPEEIDEPTAFIEVSGPIQFGFDEGEDLFVMSKGKLVPRNEVEVAEIDVETTLPIEVMLNRIRANIETPNKSIRDMFLSDYKNWKADKIEWAYEKIMQVDFEVN